MIPKVRRERHNTPQQWNTPPTIGPLASSRKSRIPLLPVSLIPLSITTKNDTPIKDAPKKTKEQLSILFDLLAYRCEQF